jgi:hypothetical protein
MKSLYPVLCRFTAFPLCGYFMMPTARSFFCFSVFCQHLLTFVNIFKPQASKTIAVISPPEYVKMYFAHVSKSTLCMIAIGRQHTTVYSNHTASIKIMKNEKPARIFSVSTQYRYSAGASPSVLRVPAYSSYSSRRQSMMLV